MERLAFCALIKRIFKTDLNKFQISCAQDFILAICKPLSLNIVQKFKIKKGNISGLKIKALDL